MPFSALSHQSSIGELFSGDIMLASRNLLMTVIVLLAAGLALAAYSLYQEKKQPDGVEIKIGEGGISIKEK